MDHAGRTNRELARLEAARWVVRLSSGNCSAAEREEFETWRKASLHHEVVYQWENLVWDRTERLQALRPADDNLDPLLLTSLVAAEPTPPPSRFRRPALRTRQTRDLSLAAVALGAGGTVLWSAYGVAIGSGPVMISNLIVMPFAIATLGMKLKSG